MLISKLSVVALLSTHTLAQKPPETYKLRGAKRVGVIRIYESELMGDFMGISFLTRSKCSYKITKLRKDGTYDLEETLISGAMVINGIETPPDFKGSRIHHFDKEGSRIEDESDEQPSIGMLFLPFVQGLDVDKSLSVGEEWDDNSESTTSKFKFVGIERISDVDTLKVETDSTFRSDDQKGAVQATWWFRADDASLQKVQMSSNKILYEGGGEGKFNFTVNRVTK